MKKQSNWSKSSWKNYPIKQQPDWGNKKKLKENLDIISKLPSIVFAGETRLLLQDLRQISKGKGFLLQVGDCSEQFSYCNGPRIHNLIRIFFQMALILSNKGKNKIIKVGRIAGQYAKPRSSNFEMINGKKIFSYRGDMVNSFDPKAQHRKPDPARLVEGYFRSTATLNLVRAFIGGGYGGLSLARDWKKHFFSESKIMNKYDSFLSVIEKDYDYEIEKKIYNNSPLNNRIYISHEGLLLDYEEALTRIDTTSGKWYASSAHMLWIGDRTRQLENAHIEFMSGINNPLGIKIGPDHNLDEIEKIIYKLNPNNIAGRITIITRFGAGKIKKYFSKLIKSINSGGYNVVWCCDPMHGNTKIINNIKTRHFLDIFEEIKLFKQICHAENIYPGGLHLEITPDNVTECLGGPSDLIPSDLDINYETKCDPRINGAQAVELALQIKDLFNA